MGTSGVLKVIKIWNHKSQYALVIRSIVLFFFDFYNILDISMKRPWRYSAYQTLYLFPAYSHFNTLRPNNDLSQTSHCNIKGLSVSEVMRFENMITQVKFYWYFNSFSPLLL